MENIPRLIHQIWFQGSHSLPEKYKAFQSTWVYQDGIEYRFWEERTINALFASFGGLWEEIYHSFPTMIQKIDFAKYVILYSYGGVYIDMDVFAVKKLTDFMESNIGVDFLTFQHNTPCITITMNKFMGLEGNKIINNAVIFCSSRNERMKKIINTCCSAQEDWKKDLLSKQLRCLVTTGPIIFTNCIRTFPDWNKYVREAEIFEPYTTLEMTKLSKPSDDVSIESNDYMKLMDYLISCKDMQKVYGIHVLDLNWFKNGKNNWKFRAYRYIQKVKKSIIQTYKDRDGSNSAPM